MYPEEFPINFPLPIELHRGIRFNLAASLLKDKLKFPVNLQDYPSIFVLRSSEEIVHIWKVKRNYISDIFELNSGFNRTYNIFYYTNGEQLSYFKSEISSNEFEISIIKK